MAIKTESETATKKSKMADLLEKISFAPRLLSKGETVEGKIVSCLKDTALVDIGAKAEGSIPLKELQEAGMKVGVGNNISAIVAQPEGDSGVVILTVKKGPKEKVWESLQEAADRNDTLEVKGISANRGGLVVEIDRLRGFVPSSHLITDAREATGRKLSVKAIEVNKNLNKLVFSEKEAAPESSPRIELPFKVGDALDVIISKILPFGLIVKISSGAEGLVHISEISWKRVGPLGEIYEVGQKLKVRVISIDPNSGRINLSIKQLEEDPWRKAAEKYPVGTVLEKKISRGASYGVFVEIEEGIEGLLHSSKIPYGVELKAGDSVSVSVDLFNSDQKRVALRLAQKEPAKGNKSIKSAHPAESKKKQKTPKAGLETKETKTAKDDRVKSSKSARLPPRQGRDGQEGKS